MARSRHFSVDPKTYPRDGSASNETKADLIEKYENQYPADAKLIDDFFQNVKNISEDDIRNIKYLLYTASEPYRSLYLRYLSDFSIGNDGLSSGAYYSPSSKTVNYEYPNSFANDPRGPYTTFFHECGHGIDDVANLTNVGGSDTENFRVYSQNMGREVSIREAILFDVYRNTNNPHSMVSIANNIIASGKAGSKGNVENVLNAIQSGDSSGLNKNDMVLFKAVINEHARSTNNGNVKFESVTDVYGGVSGNLLRAKGYGHDTSYWTNNTMAAKELWAEYFSYNMANDAEALNNLRQYYPEAAKVLDQYAKELSGRS